MNPQPFTVQVPAEVLDDLHSRLARTRWPDPLPYPGWAAGADIGYLKELVAYWAGSFDWRAREQYLNSFAQFIADIDGQRVHFVHQRGRGRDPFPLVLTHGWPSTFAELLKLVPLLTDPAAHGGDARDSFDVVIPSLPGFAYSAAPAAPGTATAVSWAGLWAKLMTEVLGYTRFGAQGQDIGAAVSIALAAGHPGVVAGIHLPGVVAFPPVGQPASAEGQAFLDRQQRWRDTEGGYAHLQATRPQTLAAGLADSPAGLAAWITENSGPGATAAARSSGGSPKMSCSPPSPCTGSPAPSAPPSSSTTTASATPAGGPGGSRCRSGWHCSPRRTRSPGPANGPKRPTTSPGGPRCPAAGTSPPPRNPSCSRANCESFSARSGRHLLPGSGPWRAHGRTAAAAGC